MNATRDSAKRRLDPKADAEYPHQAYRASCVDISPASMDGFARIHERKLNKEVAGAPSAPAPQGGQTG
jgi:hypothetical protein